MTRQSGTPVRRLPKCIAPSGDHMSLSFAHLWQQQESSDVDLVLLTQEQEELARFPAHSALLSNSPVFRAKMLRWQQEEEEPPAKRPRRSSAANNDSSSNQEPTTSTARGRLELKLQDASEQPAAMAVLASLYAVKPLQQLLSELSQEQQLLAALLADQWQVPNLSSAAAALLADAANSSALVAAVRQWVLQDALPDCLQPLLKSVLLSVLGDLEAVWADADLSQQLLRLSLPAMEALLSCDDLRVASEDTVLYTAQRYVNNIADNQQQQHARQQLAAVIRCPHLSRYWLSVSVNASNAYALLLAGLRPHLQRLLLVREAQGNYNVTAASLQAGGLLPGAPSSWGLGSRVITPVASVQLVWQLEVSELKAAAQRSFTEQKQVWLNCPHESPPLGGIAFSMWCRCESGQQGVKIGFYGRAKKLPFRACCAFACKLHARGFSARRSTLEMVRSFEGLGEEDFFDMGAMAGGWDEAAWARKGLPTSGALTIKLTVSGVPHAAAVRPAPRAGAGAGRARR